ncbi:lipocalin-like domain-containing protein [Nitrosococcus watsonii]|uniref:AttH domain-containing protein n=1 Tax=Nitrosococcus watsoni (strain C-113) TaxID=105559 RepID=D8K691_NITWC|nr:lipocalin-like domain-containing protein [Nitrosococcus watsonii]ADJ28418.1 Protein of unknown function DUF2006 [Nitrosococcus watsonii C-113]
MLRKTHIFWLLALIAIGIGSTQWLQNNEPALESQGGIPLAELLGGGEGFARVEAPWQFSFPRDHGAHSRYRTESWHFTGHLASEQEEHFGFQLSFFRVGLKPPETPARPSKWGTKEVYRGHFALTDVSQERFHAFERFSRAALGLSGGDSSPTQVWVENWRIQALEGENANFRLRATADGASIDLTLRSLKPPLLPGGDSSGQAGVFYGYQLTRLAAQGTIQRDNRIYPVKGLASLDRAWGAVPVPVGPVVWDRFLLQLDDGRELLVVRLRRRDGSGTPLNSGFLVDRAGKIQSFNSEALTIEIVDYWESPRDGTSYPARWRFRFPAQGIDFRLTPTVADQELNLLLRYWGGLVQVRGQEKGKKIQGQGYVELTGYGT